MFDIFYRYWRRPLGIKSCNITLDSVSEVHRDISEQAVETSFAVFIVPRPKQDSVEVQFSIEDGVAGLDWILESEANKAERRKVEQYILSEGFCFQDKEMNNWHYLRVEEGDIVRLCVGIIRDIYKKPGQRQLIANIRTKSSLTRFLPCGFSQGKLTNWVGSEGEMAFDLVFKPLARADGTGLFRDVGDWFKTRGNQGVDRSILLNSGRYVDFEIKVSANGKGGGFNKDQRKGVRASLSLACGISHQTPNIQIVPERKVV